MVFAKKTAAGAKSAPAKKTAPVKKAAARPAAPKPKPLTKEQKAKLVAHKAPADFKPAYYELRVKTSHDGMLVLDKMERIKGAWDNPDAKRFNLAEYDVGTLVGVMSRLQASGYSSNFHRRWKPKSFYGIILRTGMSKATGTLTVSVKGAYEVVDGKTPGKKKRAWFEDKTDATYKKIRRAARLLRGAFVTNQLPPSTGRQRKGDIDTASE